MDYFNNVLSKFLRLDRVRILTVYMGGTDSSQNSYKNILICVLKMNEGLTGLELIDGEKLTHGKKVWTFFLVS